MKNSGDVAFWERLKTTFSRNFRLTRLYANYLEHYPEIISEDMVNALTEDGVISKEEALIALLSEFFGLNARENSEDRYLLRSYLQKSVVMMDASKYENNPYYKNIRIKNEKLRKWELKEEEYSPYRGVIANDVMIFDDYTEIPPLGFFDRAFKFPAVLEGGNEWMTLTPVDLDTCEEAIDKAHGKVVTFGLGLGYYAYMVSEKDCVDSVTVVEKSSDVIKLFEKIILPQFKNAEKITIVNTDAFEYAESIMPKEGFDFAFVDIWRDSSDGTLVYKKMKALEHLSAGTEFSYWIEGFLKSRVRAENFARLLDLEELGEGEFTKEWIKKELDSLK